MFQLDNVSVEHKLMEESVINVNRAHGTIQIVRGACVMDTQTDVTLAPEYVLTVKVLLKEIIVIGVYYKQFVLAICMPYYYLKMFRCIEGYYGDPRLGIDIPCRPCPCPGTVESGHSYAHRCALDSKTQDVFCECQIGYKGKFWLSMFYFVV